MIYDLVIFTDVSTRLETQRGLGAYKIAHEARQLGYSVLVVDFSSAVNWERYTKIIDATVGDSTIAVGFSNTWFPYKSFQKNYLMGAMSNEESDSWETKQSYISNNIFTDSLSYQFSQDNHKPYIDYVKKVNPNCDCIVGGGKSFEYLTNTEFDKVFVGYSENQFKDYLQKKTQQRIVCYDMKSQNGDFDFSASRVEYVDTDCIHSEEILTIEMSRGCIFNCVFCSYPHRNQNTKDYTKYQDVLYKELQDNYDKWGTYKYYITDDTFNDYTPKLELVNEVIQSLSFKPQFEAYIRQDLVSKQSKQAQLLYDIGVRATYFGIETWNDDTAKIIRKGGTKETKIDGMSKCKAIWGDDVYVSAGIVVGLPQDTEQSIKDAISWYKQTGYQYIDNLSFNALYIKNLPHAQQFLFNSDIDLNPSKYNYTVDNIINWTRSDSGDICNFQQAEQIAAYANREAKHINKFPPKVWDPFSTYSAYCSHIPFEKPVERFFYFVDNFYFPQLMEKINA